MISGNKQLRVLPAPVAPVALTVVNGNGQEEQQRPPPAKANILLVDDRPDKLLALEAILSGLEQNLVKASSGKEALKLVLKQEFAVILLDVSMPIMDGFETASLIRKRANSEHTPIIFVTSFSNSENQIARGYSLGAVDYISSPIVPAVLKSKVAALVELFRKTEQVKVQAEELRRLEEAEYLRRLTAATDRLEAETKRNRFFTLAVDMLAIADFNGHILQSNPAWEQVLGYTPQELRAMSGLELAHPEDRPTLEQALEALRDGSTSRYTEGRYRAKDGGYRWLGWTAVPFAEEKLIYIFARDITERKRAEEQIQKLNQELERRVAALTDINGELEAFNYSISHDLRAPLRSMQSFARMLLDQEGETMRPEGRDFARRIVRSSQHMDMLLQDLLSYSRLSRTELELRALDLDRAVNEVLAFAAQDILDHKANVEVLPPLGEVLAHEATLNQVLANLLGNAFKFKKPNTTPKVRIYSTRNGDMVRLTIEDNGIGVAPEHHEKIFGLFERLHNTTTYPGTGVGLAIVRKGVDRMRGRVGVDSRLGEGCRFWVELPHAKPEQL